MGGLNFCFSLIIKKMSANFRRVKNKMIREMKETPVHTQQSWADIMLRAAQRCTSDADQKDFFKFILNPNDTWDVPEPTFMEISTVGDIIIPKFQSMTIKDEGDEKNSSVEVEFTNTIRTNGGTTFISVMPTK